MNLGLEELSYSGGAMPIQQDISTHYTHGNLVAAIRSGVESLGKTIDSVTVDDLGPVDEFHTGGRQASEHFIDQLGVTPDMHILDIGCGLGLSSADNASLSDL